MTTSTHRRGDEAFGRKGGGTRAPVGWAEYKPGSSTPQRYLARDEHRLHLCHVWLEKIPKLNFPCRNSSWAKEGTFLFNAFVLLSLNSLLLAPGSCLMAWIAWWPYQLKESWDVCYHPPQTAISPHLCQPCCLWSCPEHWTREAIQVKNNPVGWLGMQEL